MKLCPGDSQHWLAIQLRVIEPVQQMNTARTRGSEADSEPTGELGVPASHEGRCFFMPCLNEADLVLFLPQAFHDPVNPVAGDSEDGIHAPINQRLNNNVCCRLCHL